MNLRDELQEVRELIDAYSDVEDGDYGQPKPNKAMRAIQLIDSLLALPESSRERFEAWVLATRKQTQPYGLVERSGEGYLDLTTDRQWEGWQAAMALPPPLGQGELHVGSKVVVPSGEQRWLMQVLGRLDDVAASPKGTPPAAPEMPSASIFPSVFSGMPASGEAALRTTAQALVGDLWAKTIKQYEDGDVWQENLIAVGLVLRVLQSVADKARAGALEQAAKLSEAYSTVLPHRIRALQPSEGAK